MTDRGDALGRMARSIQAWQRALGRAAAGGAVIEVGEMVGSIVPAAPSRSIVNAAAAPLGAMLGSADLDELAVRYAAAGVTRFGIWAHEHETAQGEALRRAGLRVDSRPAAMALDLAQLAPIPRHAEVTVEPAADLALLAEPLSAGYGFPAEFLTHGLPGLLDHADAWVARVAGVPAAAVAVVCQGGDAGVFMVATAPALRGRGAAAAVVHHALVRAREAGCTTATLQSSAMGRSVYARLGFAELGRYELWEHRRA